MSKKLSKEALEYKEGVAGFNAWNKQNKKLEKMGLHGTDYYVRRVKELEAQVKRLRSKTKKEGTIMSEAIKVDNASKMVWVTFQKEGMHKYPAALDDPKLATGEWDDVSFLGHPHRHMFHFKDSDRSVP